MEEFEKDFECIVAGNVWHYHRKERYVSRNGRRLNVQVMRFGFRKTFENYCRRWEFNLN